MHKEALSERGKKLFPLLKNFKGFYLAGGTGLALQIGHRISIDFDLFSDKEISKDLLSEAEKVFAPNRIEISVNNSDELTVVVGGTKITFLYYYFPVVLDLVELEGLKILSAKEIAVTKAYTVGRRGSFKDYIDLYYLISGGYVGLEEIISLAEKKYGSVFNSRLFLEQLVYLEDVSDIEIEFLKEPMSKNDLIAFFEKEIKKINI